jgi:hypothetical protein
MAVAEGEFDAGSAHAEDPSRFVMHTSLERFGRCHSLGKDQSGECFRDMAAMLMEEIAVQQEENSVQKEEMSLQKEEIAVLVSGNTAMASTIAMMLQSSVEIGDTEQHTHLKPMDILDQPSDGEHFRNPCCCNPLSTTVASFMQISTMAS